MQQETIIRLSKGSDAPAPAPQPMSSWGPKSDHLRKLGLPEVPVIVLKGLSKRDLPVQAPTKYETVLNLKTGFSPLRMRSTYPAALRYGKDARPRPPARPTGTRRRGDRVSVQPFDAVQIDNHGKDPLWVKERTRYRGRVRHGDWSMSSTAVTR
jgi:hypothetical protein